MEHKVFGCKVNKFYSNKRLNYFQQHNYNTPDKTLIATCVVTDRAKGKRVKYAIQQLKQGKHLYLTGCGAFDQGGAMDYQKFFEIYPSLQTRQQQVFLLGEDPDSYNEHLAIADYELNQEYDDQAQHHANTLNTTKKFIVIQSGCDTFCTFCLTIYKRGSSRNRPRQAIIDEIQQFADQGGQEIVITGVNLAARGAPHTRKSNQNQFSSLLQSIIDQTTIPRIRISSLGPEFLDDHFFQLMRNTRFLPHFHVSIQHFDDQVLKLMNRNYNQQTLDHVLTQLRNLDRPDQAQISIGADLIVGFPGETEQAFHTMYEAIQRYGITKLHAFPFSPHQKGETVPAGSLRNQVTQEQKKQREKKLLTHGDHIRQQFIQDLHGQQTTALLENHHQGTRKGRTENYIPINTTGDYHRGQVIPRTFH